MDSQKRKLSFTFERPRVLAALPATPLRNIPTTGVRRALDALAASRASLASVTGLMSFSKAAKSRLSALVVIRALLGASFLARSSIAALAALAAPAHRAAIESRIAPRSARPAPSNLRTSAAMGSSSATSRATPSALCRRHSNLSVSSSTCIRTSSVAAPLPCPLGSAEMEG